MKHLFVLFPWDSRDQKLESALKKSLVCKPQWHQAIEMQFHQFLYPESHSQAPIYTYLFRNLQQLMYLFLNSGEVDINSVKKEVFTISSAPFKPSSNTFQISLALILSAQAASFCLSILKWENQDFKNTTLRNKDLSNIVILIYFSATVCISTQK